MNYVNLNNGIQVPILGFGTYSVKREHVKNAIISGYRLIDTAAQYGNEEAVGTAILQSGIARDEFFLCSKLWTEDIRNGMVREAFFESLRRLQTDYLDMYLIHWPAQGYEEAWIELEKLHKEGYIRAIGVSNFNESHLQLLKNVQCVTPAVNQVESHPRFHNRELVEFCKKEGIAVEAWSPFGGTGARMLQNTVLLHLAEKHHRASSQIVLRWHIQREIITIPRTTRPERLVSNMDIFDFELDDEDMENIDSIDTQMRLGADPETFTF